jgi:hypothetical protein
MSSQSQSGSRSSQPARRWHSSVHGLAAAAAAAGELTPLLALESDELQGRLAERRADQVRRHHRQP